MTTQERNLYEIFKDESDKRTPWRIQMRKACVMFRTKEQAEDFYKNLLAGIMLDTNRGAHE